MRTSVNPGRWLECLLDAELYGDDESVVVDRESLRTVELAELLRAFREILDDPVIGHVRITIEMQR